MAYEPLVSGHRAIRMDMNTDPIVVEQTFNAAVAVVWKAITDKDQMRQ